jgi:hypothetical protein
MSLISILLGMSVAGVVLWIINTNIPIDGKLKTIVNVVVVIDVLLWILNAFGAFGDPSDIYIGDVHL